MALQTPTIQELSDNIVAQISASIEQKIPLLPKSFIRVLAKTIAGVFMLLYKYAGFMFLQMFVSTATADEVEINGKVIRPLIEWGRLIGVSDPTPAIAAQLSIQVSVNNQLGVLPAGTQLTNQITGVTYITTNSVPLDSTSVTVTIQATSEYVGSVGNLSAGDTVSFVNPLANVSKNATVLSQLTTGTDAEDTEVYRQRVIDKFQKRPQGGAYADYQQWGEEVAGIINVYPYTSNFPGQVDVYVEATPSSAGNSDGIPTLAQLQTVLDIINYNQSGKANRRPANALVNTFAISRLAFDVRITGLVVDDLVSVRNNIELALTEYFLEKEPYIVGLSIPPRLDRITKTSIAGVVENIVTAQNGIFSSVIVTLNDALIDIYSLGIGEKAKLGSISYV
ncbi:baseplate J/gp47 family protein [Francisella philomiragia]|uniref:Baseplate J/gp47 family protein n=1 Tax=Francisella philomiragia TaxID=28110 RepID=A0ABS1GCU7_9GAMM|nr:baseplate J/gp47 family protein [Francisella philomiragia]MBK2258742.1 baseplate J/gp47 family protein [Francisella philomiragia]MBK2302433.1 baseplate J/gp47 family protein [Francisella philomiragia]